MVKTTRFRVLQEIKFLPLSILYSTWIDLSGYLKGLTLRHKHDSLHRWTSIYSIKSPPNRAISFSIAPLFTSVQGPSFLLLSITGAVE